MASDVLTSLPHPPRRLPILGDVFSVDRNAPTQSELALAQQLGPIYELKFGAAKFLVVSSGKLATEVNNEERWSKLVAGPFRAMRTKGFTGRGLL
ncbi:cytochrome P450, partial [Streptomyces sp. SID10244]|nr:cytochrome P450 [Streptomyces sp. SID10244]